MSVIIKTYAQAIRDVLFEEMKRDERVFVMGEDVAEAGGLFGCTRGLLAEFGKKRVRNTPISEAGFIGVGIGAAISGLRPVVELMYMDFLLMAGDQVCNQAAKWHYMSGANVEIALVIRASVGGGKGYGGQHSQTLESMFCHIPGLYVVYPSTPYDAKGLLKAAIRDDNPVLFIENKALYGTKGEIPEEEYLVPIGQADVKRPGRDITIVATSRMVLQALEAANILAKEGMEAEVIDLRTITPLDKETIFQSVAKTSRLVIAHEAVKAFGVGAEISAMVSEEMIDCLDGPILRVGAPYTPVPFNPESLYLPNAQDIVEAVKKVLEY